MSKIGKKKILIPNQVKVAINGGSLDINGPQGSKKINLDTKLFEVNVSENNELSIKPKKINEDIKKKWGMNRSLLNNAVIGVNNGYEKTLQMTGVGFRASVKGDSLNLQLGYSHDVSYKIPDGINILVEKNTTIKISGIDKELVGKVTSEIKKLKPVEPYKGKGIKEKGQYVLRKEGKKK